MEPYQDNYNKSQTNIDDSEQYGKSNVQTKFARIARDIFLSMLSLGPSIKSPCRTLPHNTKVNGDLTSSEKNLSSCVNQVAISLLHFLAVISKNKLDILPGNGTVVLEAVHSVHSLVTSHHLNCQSSIVHSTLNQVYQSVANLIKFCDDYFLYKINDEELNEEQARECVKQVERAVINLVALVDENNQNSFKLQTNSNGQFRSSLPEIPLIHTSIEHDSSDACDESDYCLKNKSWESIVTSNPPSKPPLDRNIEHPPPLPPKKKSLNLLESSSKANSLERLSIDSQDGTQSISGQYNFSYSSSTTSSSHHNIISNSHLNASSGIFESSSVSSSSAISETTVMLESSRISPPPLPSKQNVQKRERYDSHYDNVPDQCDFPDDKPPPLPPKKRAIMAYMEMFGHCHGSNNDCQCEAHTCSCASFSEETHLRTLVTSQTHYQLSEIQFSTFQKKFSHLSSSETSLDPKLSQNLNLETDPPALPPKKHFPHSSKQDIPLYLSPSNNTLVRKFPSNPIQDTSTQTKQGQAIPSENNQKESPSNVNNNSLESLPECPYDFIEELDVREHLIFSEDGKDVRGAYPDSLLVHATRDNNDHFFQDSFLTTYRTFKTPYEIIEKLINRYHKFNSSSEVQKQRVVRESFSFLVRVVSELTIYELELHLVKYLTDFIHQLLSSGQFLLAQALRVPLIEKYKNKRRNVFKPEHLPSLNVYTRQFTLLDFKSEHIAKQMTLLDSELFVKIEIPEVLAWIEQQNEEKSPNLTRFTEHFNKVSYWARTKILEQDKAKDREKYVVKFIKIMKHLRKMNNFNSYLALLSALDSAPIRRLEWQKHITEGLKEYCALIDSTSSFRAYRQALAETQPPCIPYIGLVLQDLTFVHIGNPHLLPFIELPKHIQYKNVINFSKRRQQYNIVQNIKRFREGTHSFLRHDKIIEFFGNFDYYLTEEAMWQMSETIKPRGKPKH